MNSDRDSFLRAVNVSRETLHRLDLYATELRKWNQTINLVAQSTVHQLWTRHFLEGVAAYHAVPIKSGRWVDLGSGGGLPGAVVAILAAESAPEVDVTCIEGDIRKCGFLRSLSATLKVPFKVASRRIEDMPPQSADVLSARALAKLEVLLGHAVRHLAPDGRCVFLKGESWRTEVDEALERFAFSYEKHPSPTRPDAAILVVGDISRA